MVKKICCILLTVMLALSMVVSAAPRLPVYHSGGARFFFDKSSGTITGYIRGPKDLVLPSTLGGYAVKAIGESAFAGNASLETLLIPDSVTTIESKAFNGCTSLRSVQIGAYVSSIGSGAFANCYALMDVTFMGLLENIESDAFYGAPWLNRTDIEYLTLGNTTLLRYNGTSEVVYLPAGVKHIAPKAFAYNTNIKTVFLPDGLRSIGDSAFVHCYNLSSIIIPNTVSSIGAGAFDDTIWLSNNPLDYVSVNGILVSYKGSDSRAVIPADITGIGSGAFLGNEYIKEVIIPEGVLYIDSLAFAQCENLMAVFTAQSVEWIDDYAFSNSPLATLYCSDQSYVMQYANATGRDFSTYVRALCNGNEINYSLVTPVIHQGSTYVPVTPVFEALGYTVCWDGDTSTLTATNGESTVLMHLNGTISVNGTALSTVTPPLNRHDCWMLPVRVVAEASGCSVYWDENTRTAHINK